MAVSDGDALDGSAPLYQRVAMALQERIRTGALPAGARVPAERGLSADFGVSRVTMRHALKELERQGILEASGGLRWVTQRELSGDRVEEGSSGLVSFADLNAARGLRVTSTVLRALTRRASIDEAETLEMAPGAPVFELARLRRVDDVPVVIDYSLLPAALVPGIEAVDFSGTSLYRTLAESYGVHAHSADYAVEARRADAAQAALLGREVGDPVLEAWQTTYDDRGRVIQLSHLVYHGDRYRFRAFLKRSAAGANLARRTPAEMLVTRPATAANSGSVAGP